jgi:hypothetical protein
LDADDTFGIGPPVTSVQIAEPLENRDVSIIVLVEDGRWFEAFKASPNITILLSYPNNMWRCKNKRIAPRLNAVRFVEKETLRGKRVGSGTSRRSHLTR